jgi:hypothetical protein
MWKQRMQTGLLAGLICISLHGTAQKATGVTLKWSPLGLLTGNLGLHGEYSYGRKSLTARIGIPVTARRNIEYDHKNAAFKMKATTFMAGYRTYLSRKPLKGLYLEPYFNYVHHSSEGEGIADIQGEVVRMAFTNQYNGGGFGLQLGAQFLIQKRIVIDLFFIGPSLNVSSNNLKATEISSYIPWTTVQASEVEGDIREFIDQFPFIRNGTSIMVDKNHKTVTANFKGALPGFRTGVSFGVLV